eukprot:TRINITY_DN3163_c0_g1_i13.p1 TRINITY_DN3163_c0_g1~~TRINITY_DN3163_c0_g1_i13.p1  ORF type:complete len:443 (-),score=88.15 TRINITY_DN3163_c0_g1_i13:390-1718(-)
MAASNQVEEERSSGVDLQDHDLDSFRAEWRRELQGSSSNQESQGQGGQTQGQGQRSSEEEAEETDLHKRARAYFEEGVAMEQDGKLYEAIRFYKRAVQLVPDIEREVYNYSRVHANTNRSSSRVRGGEDENHNPRKVGSGGEGTSQEDPLLEDFDNLVDRFNRALHLDNQPPIQQNIQLSSTVHIGALPAEVLNYILKWVVSSDLDLKSLENCSLVCRGFYIAARDQEIWKQISSRAFGRSCLTTNVDNICWREFYLSRSRVHFNGCYISKMTYIREGERSFQDHESYRAWHMVTYYRLIRLFPGGRMLMVLSAEDPSLTAKLMNNKNFCSIQGALFGEYRIVDNKLVCVLHKQKPKKPVSKFRRKRRDSVMYNDTPDQDFLLEFQIKGKRGKLLYWTSYTILSRYASGRETEDSVTLSEQKFPKMQFNRVGSYHFESNAPL